MNPIEIGIFVSRIEAVCDEMGLVLQRSAFSTNIKDRLDFSCALFDQHGELVAQAAHIPVHLGSMAFAMKDVVAVQTWRAGDMLMLNDPYKGGTHLPDITVVAPLFHGQGLVGFVVNRAHHANIGATSPGSMPISSSIHQEGVLIAPRFIVRQGRIDHAFFEELNGLLGANDEGSGTESLGGASKGVDHVSGDFAAQMSANRVGLERVGLLINEMGINRFKEGVRHLNDYGERIARATLKEIPDGEYCFEDFMDDDGIDTPPSAEAVDLGAGSSEHVGVVIRACVTVAGEQVSVDFGGTSAQVKGNINCPLSVAAAAVFYVFRCLMPRNTPACGGAFKPISIHAPKACLLNSEFPAAVAAGNVETSTRVVDVVSGALAKALPNAMAAASHGSMNNVAMGYRQGAGCGAEGTEKANAGGEAQGVQAAEAPQDWHYYETIGGGMGAGANGGGLSSVQTHMTNTMNTPVESLEMHYPLRIRRYQIRPLSGGFGARSGGNGIIREYEFLCPTQVTLLTERRYFSPWGLLGGAAGAVGVNRLNGETRLAKESITVKAGDRLEISTPGGGGWGEKPA